MTPIELVILSGYTAYLLYYSLRELFFRGGYPLLPESPVSSKHNPFVSIIVPVRNEERNAEACLDSLLNIRYSNREILVVDDDSTDRTPEILKNYEEKASILYSTEKPDGWVGKSWACHLGFKEAKGELLLFTDGDLIHSPSSLGAAVSLLDSKEIDMLALIVGVSMESFWEKTLLPTIFLQFHELIGGSRVNYDDSNAAWAGGYILVRRFVYEKIGGHEAVKDLVQEDVNIARRVRNAEYRLRVFDGSKAVTTKIGANFFEIWSSLVKHSFAIANYSAWKQMLLIGKVFAKTILPFILLIYGLTLSLAELSFNPYLLWSLVTIGISMSTALILSKKAGWGLRHLALLPVSGVIFMGIMFTSMLKDLLGIGVTWKSRIYRRKK